MTDLAKTIAPKSDQLNADDLIAGPITIKITQVKGSDDPDQPVSVCFEGDGGKPYKPCKSMRRVFVHCWGPDGKSYPGRRVTLYRDENVMFGGIKVGGIRISHMSHIDREMTMALTATRAKRTPYTVKPLKADVVQREVAAAPQRDTAAERPEGEPAPPPLADESFDAEAWAVEFNRSLDGLDTVEAVAAAFDDAKASGKVFKLKARNEGMAKALVAAVNDRIAELRGAS